MATFSPTDAAFEGFRIVRERPRTVLIWALAYLIVTVVSAMALITFAGETMAAMQAAGEAGEDDPALAMDLMGRLMPIYLVGLLVMTVFTAAVYRTVLRPEDGGLAYLKLGADELRLMLLGMIFIGLWALAVFAIVLVLGLIAAIAGGIAAVGGGGAGVTIVALIGGLASLALLPTFIYLWVRLSLAWPMTFAERRLRLFESWTLTRGHFWRLFGAYFLAGVLALLVMILGLVIYAAVAAILTGGDLTGVGQVFQPDMSSPGAYFTPAMIIYIVFAGALGALQYAIMFAPGAVAYRALAGGEGARA